MANEKFNLKYNGNNIDKGMEVEEVAEAMEGIARLVRVAGSAVHGEDAVTSFKIQKIKPGSLELQFLLDIGDGLLQLTQPVAPHVLGVLPGLAALNGMTISDFLKQVFAYAKHLKGKPPALIQKVKDGQAVQVQNHDGETNVFNNNVFNITNNYNLGNSVEKVVRPLRRAANEFKVSQGRRVIAQGYKSEVKDFSNIRLANQVIESSSTIYLTLRSPVVLGDGVWGFYNGGNKIQARITDEIFLAKVHSREIVFGSGDILKVSLHLSQERAGNKFKNHYEIRKVLEHQKSTQN